MSTSDGNTAHTDKRHLSGGENVGVCDGGASGQRIKCCGQRPPAPQRGISAYRTGRIPAGRDRGGRGDEGGDELQRAHSGSCTELTMSVHAGAPDR